MTIEKGKERQGQRYRDRDMRERMTERQRQTKRNNRRSFGKKDNERVILSRIRL